MKNIYLIQTDKGSKLTIRKSDSKLLFSKDYFNTELGGNQHIYITSDEEIKDGDWVYCKHLNCILQFKNPSNRHFYKKIILTTDQDLIKDGVQEIDDEFLEWFVKNPSCEFVMTIPDVIGLRDVFQPTGKDLYKIIIPKEEDFELVSIGEETIKLAIPMIQDKEDTKQETLEEAAERLYPTTINSFTDSGFDTSETERLIFKNGAKWQQEQNKKLYNEEEVIKLLKGMRVVCTFGSSEEIEDYINNINKRINGKNNN